MLSTVPKKKGASRKAQASESLSSLSSSSSSSSSGKSRNSDSSSASSSSSSSSAASSSSLPPPRNRAKRPRAKISRVSDDTEVATPKKTAARKVSTPKKKVTKSEEGANGQEEEKPNQEADETIEVPEKKKKAAPRQRKTKEAVDGEAAKPSGPQYNTSFPVLYQNTRSKTLMTRSNTMKDQASAAKLVTTATPALESIIDDIVAKGGPFSLDEVDFEPAFKSLKQVIYTKKSLAQSQIDGSDPQRSISLKRVIPSIAQLSNALFTSADARAYENRRNKARQKAGEHFSEGMGMATFLKKDTVEVIANKTFTNEFLDKDMKYLINLIKKSDNDDAKALPKEHKRWKMGEFLVAAMRIVTAEAVTAKDEMLTQAFEQKKLPVLTLSNIKYIHAHLKAHGTLANSVEGLILATHMLKSFDAKYPSQLQARATNEPKSATSTSAKDDDKKKEKKTPPTTPKKKKQSKPQAGAEEGKEETKKAGVSQKKKKKEADKEATDKRVAAKEKAAAAAAAAAKERRSKSQGDDKQRDLTRSSDSSVDELPNGNETEEAEEEAEDKMSDAGEEEGDAEEERSDASNVDLDSLATTATRATSRQETADPSADIGETEKEDENAAEDEEDVDLSAPSLKRAKHAEMPTLTLDIRPPDATVDHSIALLPQLNLGSLMTL